MIIGNEWKDDDEMSGFSCANCGADIPMWDETAMRDKDGNTFCDQTCLNEYWQNNYIDWEMFNED